MKLLSETTVRMKWDLAKEGDECLYFLLIRENEMKERK